MERLLQAINYMVEVHGGQQRKGSKLPKATHLFGVAAILQRYGYDDEVVIAGLLHDVVEDTERDIAEIAHLFGAQVAEYVLAETEIAKENPWRVRKTTQIASLKNAKSAVKAIAAADKMHNLISLYQDYQAQGEQVWQHFNAGRDDIIWYYQTIIPAICHGVSGGIFADLKQLGDKITELKGVK